MRFPWRALAIAVAIGLSVSAPARAGDVSPEAQESARKTYQAGAQAYAEGRYKDAIDLFLEAASEAPNPAFSYNIGLAYEQLGDADNALRWYRDYLRELPNAPDRGDIEPRIRDAERRLRDRGVQQVTVISTPEGATLTLDGKAVGVTPWTGELTPGRHKALLELRNFTDTEGAFELPSDHAVDVRLSMVKAAPEETSPAPPAPAPRAVPEPPHSSSPGPRVRPLTWVALGVGAAGLGSALGFELARSGAVDSARNAPSNLEGKNDYDSAQSFATLGRVALGVGAAFAVTGGVLLYLDLSKKDRGPENATGAVGCNATACGATFVERF